MPRRSVLSTSELESLISLPSTNEDLIKYYSLNESDLALIRQHRGAANRLGFAVQLCYLRFPGIILRLDQAPFSPLLRTVAEKVRRYRRPNSLTSATVSWKNPLIYTSNGVAMNLH